jgi:archaellum component FlaG (FlaF/FlaG flagellin family)
VSIVSVIVLIVVALLLAAMLAAALRRSAATRHAHHGPSDDPSYRSHAEASRGDDHPR